MRVECGAVRAVNCEIVRKANRMHEWNAEERQRYDRHFRLRGFGETGQARLRAASALVVGAGGLGSPVVQYLAAAGVGRLGIVDDDRVDRSNLQRQTLFTEADIGQSKAHCAAAFVRARNAQITVAAYDQRLTREGIADLFANYDLIIDGTDNFATRYLINDACVLFGKPLVHGAVHRWEGQVAVFNVPLPGGGRSPHYRDLFPQPPDPGTVEDCATAGVLGVLPGIIGSLMAGEAIKWLTGTGEVQHSKLLLFDSATLVWHKLRIRHRPDSAVRELIDYATFCGVPEVPTVSYAEARTWVSAVWLDVRTTTEHERGAWGPLRIAPEELPGRVSELPTNGRLVVYCQSGVRSRRAVAWLREHRPKLASFHLAGGYAGAFRPE